MIACAPTEVTLVITLGVLLALIGVAQTRWDPGEARVDFVLDLHSGGSSLSYLPSTLGRRPDTPEATTGQPHACASRATRPNDSLYEGITHTSAAA